MEKDDKKFEFYPEGTLIPMPEPISLRDYFAAAALQGAIAHSGFPDNDARYAAWAYQTADAMIKEREKA